ncbi:MAG: hypothetical protein AB8B86_13115 [Pseudomonadales bacterium]
MLDNIEANLKPSKLCRKYFAGLMTAATLLAVAGPDNNILRLAAVAYLVIFGYHSYVKVVMLRADHSIVAIHHSADDWFLQLANGDRFAAQLVEHSSVVTARFMALRFKAETEAAITDSKADEQLLPCGSKASSYSTSYNAMTSFVIKSCSRGKSYSILLFADSAAGNDLRLLRLVLLHGDRFTNKSKDDDLIVNQ